MKKGVIFLSLGVALSLGSQTLQAFAQPQLPWYPLKGAYEGDQEIVKGNQRAEDLPEEEASTGKKLPADPELEKNKPVVAPDEAKQVEVDWEAEVKKQADADPDYKKRSAEDDDEDMSDATPATEEGAHAKAVAEADRADAEEAVQAVEKTKKPKLVGAVPNEPTRDPLFFYEKGAAFLKDLKYQDALNYTNKALELNPNFWEAWYQKGLIFQLSGHDALAARRYLALIERKPEMIEPHIAMGSLYRKHGDFTLAENEYRKVINLNVYNFAAHYNLANLLMDQKRMEEALKEYRVCLKLKPANAEVHNNVGVIYQEKRYYEDAIEEFKRASTLEPANDIFHKNYTEAKLKLAKKPILKNPAPAVGATRSRRPL